MKITCGGGDWLAFKEIQIYLLDCRPMIQVIFVLSPGELWWGGDMEI